MLPNGSSVVSHATWLCKLIELTNITDMSQPQLQSFGFLKIRIEEDIESSSGAITGTYHISFTKKTQ